MTSAIALPGHIIGLMSGTSADGVDAALLHTDGRDIVRAGESVFVPYADALRTAILALMQGVGNVEPIAYALTDVHIDAVRALLKKSGKTASEISLVGFHGQTLFHFPHKAITMQIGDPAYMAKTLGIPVIADFRSNDMRNGGQGAPLVPLYHAALATALPKPLMVVNIGGVANVTWMGGEVLHREPAGDPRSGGVSEAKGQRAPSIITILAFDCGPGNALLDDWVREHTGARYDKNGELAARGTVDEAALADFLSDPFFTQPAPKSLDRNQFRPTITGTPENGAATLTAMTAAAIAKACELTPQKPHQLLITGGGRHNPTLMQMIAHYSGCIVAPVESVGWDGDMLEAQAFAYLAARSVQELPLSLPTTTGVAQPTTGGVLYQPK